MAESSSPERKKRTSPRKPEASDFPPPAHVIPDDDPRLAPTVGKPDREALRRHLVEKCVEQGAVVPEETHPILWLMAGGSGAGKSYVLEAMQDTGLIPKSGLVHINADNFKEELPEFKELVKAGDGRAANVVHEESNIVALSTFLEATKRRCNIIYDGTLSDFTKGANLVGIAVAQGYEVRMVAVTARPEENSGGSGLSF